MRILRTLEVQRLKCLFPQKEQEQKKRNPNSFCHNWIGNNPPWSKSYKFVDLKNNGVVRISRKRTTTPNNLYFESTMAINTIE